mmetsp:Transcript_9369/g.20149  ORF Transcript_9369/g.20149 Transcript_9369/m.20149 type:complete len:593 (-) Transcript_9369:190-1968(-)
MAKTKSSRGKGGKKQCGGWSNAEHDARTAKRIASLNKKRQRQLQHDDVDDAPVSNETKKVASSAPSNRKRQIKKRHRTNLSSHVPDDTYKRSFLSHDNLDQIESSKLRLAISQTQRKVDALRMRLEKWDPAEEAKRPDQEEEADHLKRVKLYSENMKLDEDARKIAQHDQNLLNAKRGINNSHHRRKANLKKKPRPGPETWKLRGAARPAWEVYDFDTRYVDPHIKAKEEAAEKATRIRNVIALCRGRFALDSDDDDKHDFHPPQPQCREFLSSLTQLGSLHLEKKNYSSARKAFLEVLELEGTSWPYSITNARTQLMNMYLETNRPASARRLWEQLENDGSAWIRYSAALIEYVSWNLLQEKGSTAETAEKLLTKAIRGNVYVAFFLGWRDTMDNAMEYTEELVEYGDCDSGSILEAIEYACSTGEDKGMGMWEGTEGSLEWVRSVILRVLNDDDRVCADQDSLTKADLLSWETKLSKEEESFDEKRNEQEEIQKTEDDIEGGRNDQEPDLLMYAGMFRTGMDWLQDAGDFLKSPSYAYLNDVEKKEEEMLDTHINQGDMKIQNVNDSSSGATGGDDEDSETETESDDDSS